jgi:hypothetical protein
VTVPAAGSIRPAAGDCALLPGELVKPVNGIGTVPDEAQLPIRGPDHLTQRAGTRTETLLQLRGVELPGAACVVALSRAEPETSFPASGTAVRHLCHVARAD